MEHLPTLGPRLTLFHLLLAQGILSISQVRTLTQLKPLPKAAWSAKKRQAFASSLDIEALNFDS